MLLDLEPIFLQNGASIPVDTTFQIDDELIGSPVRLTGRIFNQTGIVRIEADASYVCSAKCARCNKSLLLDTKVSVRHVLVPPTEREDEEGDAYSDDSVFLDEFRLDPEALASEDLFLEMPFRFLCREDCRGLCPVCGADLNQGDCGCKKPTDARWDALKDLF